MPAACSRALQRSIRCHSSVCAYGWAWPQFGQNLLTLGIDLPQLRQNFASAPATAPPPAGTELSGVEVLPFFSASIMAFPIAIPAPRPAPTPAAPPPSLAAATGMDCATWYCVYRP